MLTRWKTKWPTYHFLLSKVIIRCNYYRTNFVIRSFILFLSGNFPELFPTLISSQERRLSWEYAIGITDFATFCSMLSKQQYFSYCPLFFFFKVTPDRTKIAQKSHFIGVHTFRKFTALVYCRSL